MLIVGLPRGVPAQRYQVERCSLKCFDSLPFSTHLCQIGVLQLKNYRFTETVAIVEPGLPSRATADMGSNQDFKPPTGGFPKLFHNHIANDNPQTVFLRFVSTGCTSGVWTVLDLAGNDLYM